MKEILILFVLFAIRVLEGIGLGFGVFIILAIYDAIDRRNKEE